MSGIPEFKRKPDFSCLKKVLRREPVSRPVLFELMMNDTLYSIASEDESLPSNESLRPWVKNILAYKNLGYDYATLTTVPGFEFKHREQSSLTISLNEEVLIDDWKSFEEYNWPSIDNADFKIVEDISKYIPEGMKLIAAGPWGVEENVLGLTGYENLCYMTADDEELVGAIFEQVGSRIVEYYRRICEYPWVGAIISNDDWGFKTQTLLSLEQMKKFLFPWHKKITDLVHHAGLPVILHSCGNVYQIMDIIIDDLKYDAKHSFEDEIKPVEEAYKEYSDRIAILGGIDLDFICQKSPEEVYSRSRNMIEQTKDKGGYALGTGNSVPEYVPFENYFAMLRAAQENG